METGMFLRSQYHGWISNFKAVAAAGLFQRVEQGHAAIEDRVRDVARHHQALHALDRLLLGLLSITPPQKLTGEEPTRKETPPKGDLPVALRDAVRTLVGKHHSDRGGSETVIRQVNTLADAASRGDTQALAELHVLTGVPLEDNTERILREKIATAEEQLRTQQIARDHLNQTRQALRSHVQGILNTLDQQGIHIGPLLKRQATPETRKAIETALRELGVEVPGDIQSLLSTLLKSVLNQPNTLLTGAFSVFNLKNK